MRNEYYTNSKDYINRWVISYADFVTMLLALFMVMWAVNGMDNGSIKTTNKSVQNVFTAPQKILEKDGTKAEYANSQTATVTPSEQDKILEILQNNKTIKSKTKLLKSEKGAIIRLNDKMLFSQGSAIIKPEVLGTLDNIAAELKTLDNFVIIEGHTDSTPIKTTQFPSNWELSTARATNIINYLISKDGLNPKRLSAVGYGEFMPVAPNTTFEGKTQNRRVDIIILSSNKSK